MLRGFKFRINYSISSNIELTISPLFLKNELIVLYTFGLLSSQ